MDDTREVRAEKPTRERDSGLLATAGSCCHPRGRGRAWELGQELGWGGGCLLGVRGAGDQRLGAVSVGDATGNTEMG